MFFELSDRKPSKNLLPRAVPKNALVYWKAALERPSGSPKHRGMEGFRKVHRGQLSSKEVAFGKDGSTPTGRCLTKNKKQKHLKFLL